ncbi:M50 family metallopeptidase [Methanocella arvoryzae]|uniref:Peptidase M50 domain-containing protein n=1 Tax=Methanocella arvoryzae (strain DSM 22066 / NBRC 105507 / MRE50) TaxID=351160 RepID=Q0W6D7_METAR|nr:M50 family metallopeptidase [Methanocella arvoryzae]CAJ36056.1 hypothetical protein RCIA29 [Methanocella arvoryzae MRE50]
MHSPPYPGVQDTADQGTNTPAHGLHKIARIEALPAILQKIIFTAILIWLFNVLFVGIHEMGHALAAICCGAKVCSLYVSLSGFNGATTYTLLTGSIESSTVMLGGILLTVTGTIVLYYLKMELALYVVGLRTIESLNNYNPGSDMTTLLQCIGPWSYLISIGLTCLLTLCMWYMLYEKRLKTYSPKNSAPEI